MKVISTVIEYKGNPVKIKDGRVFVRAFGTTYYNQKMHHSWQEIKIKDLKRDFKQYLVDNKLLNV